jgi:hypothetical protein
LHAEHARKCLKVEYFGRIEYDFQKSRVTGPWDHMVSVSAKKSQKISCLCTFNHSRDANNAGTLTTPVAEDMSTAVGKAKTAEAPAIAGTPGTSTAVRTTASAAKETSATA